MQCEVLRASRGLPRELCGPSWEEQVNHKTLGESSRGDCEERIGVLQEDWGRDGRKEQDVRDLGDVAC